MKFDYFQNALGVCCFFDGLVCRLLLFWYRFESVQLVDEQVQPRLLAMFVFSQAGSPSPVTGHKQLRFFLGHEVAGPFALIQVPPPFNFIPHGTLVALFVK